MTICVQRRPQLVCGSSAGQWPHPPRYHSRNVPGVYISHPFCAQKCTYCNFASGVFPRELEPRYVKALVREISGHEWAWKPETIYLGGGTPSGMAADDLERILRCGRGSVTEATIE